MAKISVKNPPATQKSTTKSFVSAEALMKMSDAEAIRALADYDGPVRQLVEAIIALSGQESIPKSVLDRWVQKSMAIMNVIYKVNGVKTSYVVAQEPPIPKT